MSQKPHVQISSNVLYMLPVAVARSSCDGNPIHCTLPGLWTTSRFQITEQMGQNQRRRICYIYFARWRHRGRGMPSPTASCYVWSSLAVPAT